MKHLLPAIALGLLLASAARAQLDAIRLPLAVRGFVHREVGFGCGQAWSAQTASTNVTLDVDASRHARLHVEAHVVDAVGGVSMLDDAGAFHDETERSLVLDWSGRARIDHGALVIQLGALIEHLPMAGSTSGMMVTNRTSEPARLSCTRAPHDVMRAQRPAVRDHEPAGAYRSILTCTFDPTEHEGPLPRPVRDVLTVPFFLDEGAGVTTDAIYRGHLTIPPDELVAREPGWVDP